MSLKKLVVKEYIELNHKIEHGMETYPGLSKVEVYEFMPRFGNNALIDGINLFGISGTYIDAPYHEDPNGDKICDYPLEKLVNLPVIVVDKPESRVSFEVEDFAGLDVDGCAVLLNSKHDRFFGTEEYGKNTPYLSEAAALYLVQKGVALVGIDSPLVDNIETSEHAIPVHATLLTNGVVICEDMTNIESAKGKTAYLTAVPPRVPLASFPARVFATVLD
ncbi:cyclase family protein [Vibrio sp.]|uniref:Metal-dependent hydrolase n=1 Tax=Vibrio viridaestus TaxID=2487322 RepID=A0A3N9TL74_9VIBR|nr:cyclase family protein [Vibrio viridaestus]MDC0612659.1 cyclase family protein [Vibrio sp.]RQW64734.1 metal-dependent hydrolase [Vibrio viridaestus]